MTVREMPLGSGIHGRPILDRRTRHIARYHQGAWWTWCGERVPDDHMCPRGRDPNRDGTLENCETCHSRWHAERV